LKTSSKQQHKSGQIQGRSDALLDQTAAAAAAGRNIRSCVLYVLLGLPHCKEWLSLFLSFFVYVSAFLFLSFLFNFTSFR
jgi:hypothetical protein